jgi:hypothetical protein
VSIQKRRLSAHAGVLALRNPRRSLTTPAVAKSLRPWPEPKSTISGRTPSIYFCDPIFTSGAGQELVFEMETPKYYEFMNPTLQALREKGGTLTNEEIVDAVASSLIHNRDTTPDFRT